MGGRSLVPSSSSVVAGTSDEPHSVKNYFFLVFPAQTEWALSRDMIEAVISKKRNIVLH